jgi:type III secretory pathway component EscU
MEILKKQWPHICALLGIIGGIGLLAVTHPAKVPLAGLFLPFLVVGAMVFGVIRSVFRFTVERQERHFKWSLVAGVVTVWSIMLLMLSSLGQLVARDVVLFSLLAIGCIFYVVRRY